MSQFSDSGMEAIRQALFARNKKYNLANLARDMGIASAALEAFIFGQGRLTPDVLKKLASFVWGGHSEYEPAIDKLRPVNRDPPRSMGVKPEPFDPKKLPTYRAGPPQNAPRMVKPFPERPKRPGGATVIRQMLAARNKNFNIAPLAIELSISSGELEDFAYGRTDLAPEVLQALAKILFDGNDEYDPAIDELRPAKREEPRPMGIVPPPITERMTLPVYQAGPAPPSPGMVTPAKPRARRAGWVD